MQIFSFPNLYENETQKKIIKILPLRLYKGNYLCSGVYVLGSKMMVHWGFDDGIWNDTREGHN